MGRIAKHQRAGLDFLDRLFFAQMVVSHGMLHEEQVALYEVLEEVYLAVIPKNLEPVHSVVVTHTVLGLLQIGLADDLIEKDTKARGKAGLISPEDVAKAQRVRTMLSMASLIASVEMVTGHDVSMAIGIYETVREKLADLPALVRHDLVIKAFVFVNKEAPLAAYCWMAKNKVLDVEKFKLEELPECGAGFLQGLLLVSLFDEVNDHARRGTELGHFDSEIEFILKSRSIQKDEDFEDELYEIFKVETEARLKERLRNSYAFLAASNCNVPENVQGYFNQVAVRRQRLRACTGTLASWPGVIGAGVIYLAATDSLSFEEAMDRIRLNAQRREEGKDAYAPKIKTIFSNYEDADTITNDVRLRMTQYGLHINARTLNTAYQDLRKGLLRLVSVYASVVRKQGVALPAEMEDKFYISTFPHVPKDVRKPMKI